MGVDPVSLAINAALFAANAAVTASQKIEGPRLDDLKVTTADYGTPLNYGYGTRRFDGVSCIWAERLREVPRQRKSKGGKSSNYSYFGTWAVAVCDHEVAAVTRIWFDRNLVYDATSGGPVSPFAELGDISQYITIYLGTADQDVDARISATVDAEHGAGSTPAYRGVCTIVFKDLPLEKLGNRLPQVSVEVITAGAQAFPKDVRTAATLPFINFQGFAFSPDGTRAIWHPNSLDAAAYEIWDVSARALMISGSLDDSLGGAQAPIGIGNDGTIYVLAADGSDQALRSYPADGLGPATELAEVDNVAGLQVLTDGHGVEWVCLSSYSTTRDGYLYAVGGAAPVRFLDTAAETGQGWQIKFFFRDLYGRIIAVGGRGDLATDELAIWVVAGADLYAGPEYGFVTMPNVQTATIAIVFGYHYRSPDGAIDQFVIAWGGTGAHLVAVDVATLTVNTSRAYGLDPYARVPAFSFVQPGAASIWHVDEEISSADLSTIRSIDVADWGVSGPLPNAVYDRVNHAMLVQLDDEDLAWLYLDRVSGNGVTLGSIVEDVAERCGLEAGDIDASDLDQTVQGYSWTQGTGKAILEPLLEAYDSEARPHDFQVQFLRRGAAALGTMPVADMGAGGSTRYEAATTLDSDLPLKVSLTFADIDRDQQPNTALGQRAGAATDSRRELSLDATTLVLTADEARQMADGYLRRSWMKAQEINLSVSRKWTKLEPGDVYTLSLDDVARTAKLNRLEFGANGVLTTTWERYAASVHTATGLAGAPADGLATAVMPSFGYSKGLVLDTPLVTDGDDGIIAYAAASPYSTGLGWPGAIIWRGDDGVTYDDEFASVSTAQEGTIGYAQGVLADALTTVIDRASSVTVKLFSGELTSATEAEVLNGANVALIGQELIGFTTATLVAANTYALSGFLRGVRGTEWATGLHASGERFVLMATAQRGVLEASDIGDTLYFKPITQGGAEGFPQSFVYTAASRKPYAPAHAAANDDGTDIDLSWVRRTRIGGSWRDFMDASLGETSESYEVDILNGSGTVIRTLSGLTTPAATYTAAQRATDGGAGAEAAIYQIAPDLSLRGFPTRIAI